MIDDLANADLKGELVYVKKKDQVIPCYIPFSKNSGDAPIIATEQYVDAKMYSATHVMNGIMRIEGRGSRVVSIPFPKAEFGDLVVVTTSGDEEPNYSEFALIGRVKNRGNIGIQFQNIVDNIANFPALTIHCKLIKF